MAGNLLFALCAPDDYEWTNTLVNYLIANEYNVYLDSPDQQNIQTTLTALQQTRIMLVVVSQESALGDSAAVFEDWWRPFVEQDRSIITVIKPGEPAGVEHWMPFDLRTFPTVSFDHDEAYAELRQEIDSVLKPGLNPVPEALPALPSPVQSIPEVKAPASPRPVYSRPEPPPIPTARASYAIEKATNRRRERRFWRNILFGPIVFALLVALWVMGLALADAYGSTTALFMVTASVILSTIITLVVMALRGRRSKTRSRSKQDIKAGIRSRRRRPDVYIEVVSSVNRNEMGKIFAIDRPRISIGKDSADDIRIRDRKIDKEHSVIFYNQADSCYYLENLSSKSTVVHDRALRRGEVSQIENGDLIVLGDSVVLQFRTIV